MWQWFFPTRVFFGQNAIIKNYADLKSLGHRALIVTGRGGSSLRNGSLSDIGKALEMCSIAYTVFDQVEPNPSVATVRNGAEIARNMEAEFVIGLGGGSALDAAKAIAVLAVNRISDEELFNLQFNQALPLVAVPTTAGTGSEVTPACILTWPQIQNKKNVSSPLLIPHLAFLDPGYTLDLPLQITRDTAVDAFSHALEGYLSIKATPVTDMLARQALSILGEELRNLTAAQALDYERRKALLYASFLSGLVISQTGTSIPHSMGYSFTFYKDIPHGRANGMIIPAYMDFNLSHGANSRVTETIRLAGFDSLDSFKSIFKRLTGAAPLLSPQEKEVFLDKAAKAKSIAKNIIVPNRDDIEKILSQTVELSH